MENDFPHSEQFHILQDDSLGEVELYRQKLSAGLTYQTNPAEFYKAFIAVGNDDFQKGKFANISNRYLPLDDVLNVPHAVRVLCAKARIRTNWAPKSYLRNPRVLFKLLDSIPPTETDDLRDRATVYTEFLNYLLKQQRRPQNPFARTVDAKTILGKAPEYGVTDQGLVDALAGLFKIPAPKLQTDDGVPPPPPPPPPSPPPTTTSSVVDSRIQDLLRKHFTNGIRPSDFIDQRKLRNRYRETYGEELTADWDFAANLPMLGVVSDNKVFPLPAPNDDSLMQFIRNLVEQGHSFFFYEKLLQMHPDEFGRHGIYSCDLLRDMLQMLAPDDFDYGPNTFSVIGTSGNPVDLFVACFTDDVPITAESFRNHFPYLTDECLHRSLGDKRFIRDADGAYRLATHIILDVQECDAAKRYIEKTVHKKGYASLADIGPLFVKTSESNTDVPESTFYAYFYAGHLASTYDRRGNIVFLKGQSYDSMAALRDWCRSVRNGAMLEQIKQFAKTHSLPSSYALSTALDELVRVSETELISPQDIRFDARGIDEALAQSLGDRRIVSIRQVTDFSLFPEIQGRPWNPFLLHSYLRRTPESKFRHISKSSASQDVCGGIVRKVDETTPIEELFARAAADADISPDADAVDDFLYKQGYILRRRSLGTLVAEAVRRLTERNH